MVLAGLLAAGLLGAALRGGSYGIVERAESFIAVWWAIGLAVVFGLLPRQRWSPTARVAVGALFALAAWTALGLVWTDSEERTFEEVVRTLGYAGLVAVVVSAFSARDRPLVLGFVTLIAGAVCVLALLAVLAPEVLDTPNNGGAYDTTRLSYPFNYWNALGCWAAMTLALSLSLSASAARRWLRAVCLAIACLAPVVAYLTYSRTALLALAIVVVLVVGLSSRRWVVAGNALIAAAGAAAIVVVVRGAPEVARGSGTEGRWPVIATIAVVCVAAGAVALIGPHERLGRVRLARRTTQRILACVLAALLVAAIVVGPQAWRSFTGSGSAEAGLADPAERLTSLGGTRRLLWDASLEAFVDHPLEGIGAGQFEWAWNRYPRRSGHVLDAHSLYLESLAELGLLGGLLVIVAFGALLVGGLREAPRQADAVARGAVAGCAAAFVVFCVAAGVDWIWESTAVCCLGLALGALAIVERGPPLARPRWPVRAGVGIVAGVAILVQLPVLVAATQVRTSQAAAADGRLLDALSAATAAAKAEPWAATGYLQRALVLEQLGQLTPAAAAARDATRHGPGDWQMWLVLGRIQAQRGRIPSALAAVRHARALNPRAALFQPGVARRLVGPRRSP